MTDIVKAKVHRDMLIGALIQKVRHSQGMTMLSLAKAIGVSAPFMSDVENGRRSIVGRLDAVAEALTVKKDIFLEEGGVCSRCDGTGLTKRAKPWTAYIK